MNTEEERLVPVSIPSLLSILVRIEKQKGVPLNEEEVLRTRDSAVCVMMPISRARVWESWNASRRSASYPT